MSETYRLIGHNDFVISEKEVNEMLQQIDGDNKGAISLEDYERYTLSNLKKSAL